MLDNAWLCGASPEPILVTGMPRSGTKMMVNILQRFGVYMGVNLGPNEETHAFKELNRQTLDLLGCAWRNPEPYLPSVNELYKKYFWVPKKIMISAFYERNQSLDNRFFVNNSVKALWGWKCTRSGLLLPFWHLSCPGIRVIHIVRNRKNVAISNVMCDWLRFPDLELLCYEDRRKMYLRYLALRDYFVERINEACCYVDKSYLIDYDKILADPVGEVTKLAEFLELPEDHIEYAADVVDTTKIGRHKTADLSFTKEEEE